MKRLLTSTCLLVFLSLFLGSCQSRDEKFIPEKFQIERTSVKLPFEVKELIVRKKNKIRLIKFERTT